ncbi:MAG: secondary thiamine-phosphate synthase enzyme YjbQ [Proteobacteria bacterium]|nr:secondary thiamine-phosphate synthase enzyme YjbQ [Pseudomonadota bacterium]
METISIKTKARNEFVDLTREINQVVKKSGVQEGFCLVYVPHTTAGVTINEGADPDVVKDILKHLEEMVPAGKRFLHAEGNSDAHIKSSLVGASQLIPIAGGKLALGTWQAVFFCEFDGPRTRQAWVQVLGR